MTIISETVFKKNEVSKHPRICTNLSNKHVGFGLYIMYDDTEPCELSVDKEEMRVNMHVLRKTRRILVAGKYLTTD